MSSVGLAFSIASAAAALVTALGLWRTGRIRAGQLFFGYLVVAVLVRPPVWLWPDRFYTWGYWAATDLLQTAIALAAALELNWRVYGHLPAGRRRAANLIAVAAGVSLLAVLAAQASAAGVNDAASTYRDTARIINGITVTAAALFAVFIGLATWYGLPTDPFHQEIAGGFIVWYLLIASGEQLAALDPFLGLGRSAFERVVHLGVLAAWGIAAWRRPSTTGLPPSALAFLQPWRRTT